MLKTDLLHPDLNAALAAAGHGSTVLIADGNYPASTGTRPGVPRVHLNLSPGLLGVVPVLRAVIGAVPVEQVSVMQPESVGPYALEEDPPVWSDILAVMHEAELDLPLSPVERFAFYDRCHERDLALVVVSAETAIYGNVLLRIGVRQDDSQKGSR